jgi:hypothetical protein
MTEPTPKWELVESHEDGRTYRMAVHTKQHGCIGWLYRVLEFGLREEDPFSMSVTFVPMPDDSR